MITTQAFSVSVACMDGKIADRKGYEYMRKLAGTQDNNNSNSNSVSYLHFDLYLHLF